MNTISFPIMQKQHTNLAKGRESIWQGLRLLLNTGIGELHSDPAFGCGVKDRLFKANDTFNRTMIKEDTYIAIKKFAPYVAVRREDIKVTSQSMATVTVEIKGTSLLDFTNNIYEIDILRTV